VTKCACGKTVEPGRLECFRCRVSSVGFTWRGGALEGRRGFNHMTRGEFLKEHLGVDSEKELARNPNISRYDPSVGGTQE